MHEGCASVVIHCKPCAHEDVKGTTSDSSACKADLAMTTKWYFTLLEEVAISKGRESEAGATEEVADNYSQE